MKKVLIIDDEPDAAQVLQLILQFFNYESEYYVSLQEVPSLTTNDYKIVFCDYTLINMDGIEVYKAIKAQNIGLSKKFVLVTGAGLDYDVEDFIEQEGIYVVKKPYKIESIKNIVDILEAQ